MGELVWVQTSPRENVTTLARAEWRDWSRWYVAFYNIEPYFYHTHERK